MSHSELRVQVAVEDHSKRSDNPYGRGIEVIWGL